MEAEEIIRKTFYDPETGFTGSQKLYERLKSEGITKKQIDKFLKKQEITQVFRKNYGKLGSFVPPEPLYEFQIDLIHLDNKHLNKAAYGLVCIDTFTKKGDVELMKRKSAPQVVEAMEKILQRMGKPKFVYCDEGTEFTSSQFKKLMADNNIEIIYTLRHATIVERFNRTIKELLNKYLQATDTKTITNVLPKILKNYNNSYHKTIGMAPNEVNDENKEQVHMNILKKANIKKYEPIKVGDKVRVQLKRKSFEKGYKPKFSKQVYTIDAIEDRYYIINELLPRKYLRAFIQKVGEIEKSISPADLEGTKEGHLKELAKRPIDPDSIERADLIEQERSIDPVSSRTRSRTKQTSPLNSP